MHQAAQSRAQMTNGAAVEVARARRIQHIVDELSILTEEELIILSEAAKLLERVESHSQQQVEVV